MESLYNISNKLSSIFNSIEDNEGEITEEQAKELEITEENLKEKLTDYTNYVNELKNNVESCKCEEKRLHEIRKVRENRIDRLKSRMLEAVLTFGLKGKTNKYIELPCARLSSSNRESSFVLEERIVLLYNCIYEYLRGDKYNIEDSLETAVNKINYIAQTNFQMLDADLFTIDDIKTCEFTITKRFNFIDLLKDNTGIIADIQKERQRAVSDYEFKDLNTATTYKNAIDTGAKLTIAIPKKTTSLLIK